MFSSVQVRTLTGLAGLLAVGVGAVVASCAILVDDQGLPPADVDANSPGPSCTPSASGSPCGADAVCAAGKCEIGCWIDGGFVDAGVTVANGCEVCAPGTSVSLWTYVSGPGNCPAASVCNLGSCASGCSIGGTFEAPDAASSPARCQICDPTKTTAAWTEVCEPVLLAMGTAPYGLAIDATNVYWSNSLAYTIDYCAIAGCNGDALPLASHPLPKYPQAIAVVAGVVYWEDYQGVADGYIQSCPAGAEECTPQNLSSGSAVGLGMAVDQANVYWTTGTGTVVSCARTGCSNEPTTLVSHVTSGSIAVDSANLYLVSGANTQAVSKCPLSGCDETATTLVSNLPGAPGGGASSIATDGRNVYVLVQPDAGSWALESCAVAGCGETPTTLATGAGLASQVAVYGEDVFFTTGDDGGVFECPVSGCGTSPTVLAVGQNGAAFLAVNATYVFWVNYYGGQVQRLTR